MEKKLTFEEFIRQYPKDSDIRISTWENNKIIIDSVSIDNIQAYYNEYNEYLKQLDYDKRNWLFY